MNNLQSIAGSIAWAATAALLLLAALEPVQTGPSASLASGAITGVA
jgi:hypothetical protein